MSDPNTPSVPPVPPVPAAAQPAPRYGEFAPVETGAPAAPEPVAAPVAAPGYPAAPAYPTAPAAPGYPGDGTPAAPAQPAYGQPTYGQAAYGQPAYTQPAYGQPVYGQPVYGQPGFGTTPAPKRRRMWDVVLTIVLLVLGLGGLALGLVYAWIFSQPELLDEVFQQQGLSGFSGDAGSGGAIIAISHVVLYLVALGLSILLLVKRKIAFYVPLTAGVIAAVIFWGTMIAIMASDPALLNEYSTTGY